MSHRATYTEKDGILYLSAADYNRTQPESLRRRRELLLAVACEGEGSCGAPCGHYCITANGNPIKRIWSSHVARFRKAGLQN